MDATHQLDSIVGGKAGDPMGMGDLSINRSIGAQWKPRHADLQKAVNKAREEHKEKLNVELDVCDE